MNLAETLLFSRLESPVAIVREQAAREIAGLMTETRSGRHYTRLLMMWISNQRYETRCTVGLMALLWASLVPGQFECPSPGAIREAVRYPSPSAKAVVSLIDPSTTFDLIADIDTSFGGDEAARSGFHRLMRYVPRIFSSLANEIENRSEFDFRSNWMKQYVLVGTRQGRFPSLERLQDIGFSESEHYPTYTLEAEEQMESAFQRSLAKYFEIEGYRGELAALFIPACPSIWIPVLPGPPQCWTEQVHEIGDATSNLREWCELAWRGQSERPWAIATAESRVLESNDLVVDIRIQGFYQRAFANTQPNNSQIANVLDSMRFEVPWSDTTLWRISPPPDDPEVYGTNGWFIYPASAGVRSNGHGPWLHHLASRGIDTPLAFEGSISGSVDRTGNLLSFKRQDEEVGRWMAWHFQFSAKMVTNLLPSTGKALFVKRSFVDETCRLLRARFSWLVTLSTYQRKHGTGKFTRDDQTVLLGGGKIIVL